MIRRIGDLEEQNRRSWKIEIIRIKHQRLIIRWDSDVD